jgi:hypothetical protein
MTIASFVSEGFVTPVSLGASRISLQHTVVAFLLIELTLFFLCAIAPSFYLELFGHLAFSHQQFETQLGAAAVGIVIYLVATRLYPVYSPAHILDSKLNIQRLVLILLVTFSSRRLLRTIHAFGSLIGPHPRSGCFFLRAYAVSCGLREDCSVAGASSGH